MPKKISIKTVDGNRYEFNSRHDYEVDVRFNDFYVKFNVDGETKFISCRHIVSITEKEVE